MSIDKRPTIYQNADSAHRYECHWCWKKITAYVPYMGDGSVSLVRKHKGKDGKTCNGSYRMVQ